MAAPTESMRMKLSFESFHENTPLLARKIWILVDSSKTRTICELEHEIQSRLSLPCRFQLFMDGCLLPSWESVRIIRDNEELCIVPEPSSFAEHGNDVVTAAEATAACKQHDGNEVRKKKKKKKRKYSQLEEDIEVAGHMSGGSTTSTLEVEIGKKNNYMELADEDSVQYKKSKSPVTGLEMQVDKDVCDTGEEKEQECSAMENAIRKTLEAVMPVTAPNDQIDAAKEKDDQSEGQKRKRRRTRRRKKKSTANEIDSFHDSSVIEASTPTVKDNGLQKGTAPNQKQADWNDSYRVNNFGATHVKFGESDDEEPVKGNAIENDSLDKTSAVAEESQTKRDVVCKLSSTDKQKSTSCDKAEIRNQTIQPTLATKTNCGKPSPKDVGELERISKSEVSGSCTPKVTCVTTFQKGPFASVKVFNRKLNKKADSVALTKEEQLNSVATNKSFIFHNRSTNSQNMTSTSAEKQVMIKGVVAGKSLQLTEVLEPQSKDYSHYPELIGPPRAGDVIAYKIIEMSANYSPELSEYKEAKVLKYDTKSQDVEVELLTLPDSTDRKLGRFDVTIEDEDCIITNTEEPQTMMKIPWTSLIQPRLVT